MLEDKRQAMSLPFTMMFQWAGDNTTLRVWVRRKGVPRWDVWNVTPNPDGQYELHAFGRRIFAVPRSVAELLVKVLPGPDVEPVEIW